MESVKSRVVDFLCAIVIVSTTVAVIAVTVPEEAQALPIKYYDSSTCTDYPECSGLCNQNSAGKYREADVCIPDTQNVVCACIGV